MRLPSFLVRFQGRDVFDIKVRRSGASYAPELEWVFAAIWAGYTQRAFRRLEGAEQAEIVAAYRCRLQLDAVLEQEAERERKRK